MRFRAGLPLRAKGCAIPTTEQRPSRDFRIRKNFVLSGEKSQGRSREGGIEGAEVLTLEKRSREGIEKLYNNLILAEQIYPRYLISHQIKGSGEDRKNSVHIIGDSEEKE